jgi:hypothetical protein
VLFRFEHAIREATFDECEQVGRETLGVRHEQTVSGVL